MKRTDVRLRAAALLAALCLAGCSGSGTAQAGQPEAPEYPWADSYETTVAALDEAGADYESAMDEAMGSILLTGGALFGVPTQAISLTYGGDGSLQAVTGMVAADNCAAMEQAMRSALGDPVESYRPAVYSTLDGMEVYLSDDLVPLGLLCWHSDQPLSETLPDNAVEAWQQALEQTGLRFEEEPAETITVNGEERTLWHGTEALEQYLANNWAYAAGLEYTDGSDGRVTLSRVVWPFA